MCGIIGYVGKAQAAPILLSGLRRLEYRGYDSAGIAIPNCDTIQSRKCAGPIANLTELLEEDPLEGVSGISHTRWATHGKPTDANAHPHFDRSGKLALVHNGVIENYKELKAELGLLGHLFFSETDTEVLAHLIGYYYDSLTLPPSRGRLTEALRMALKRVKGTYGVVLLHQELPGLLVGARRGSPLVLGVGKGENFLASDSGAIVAHTQEAIYLHDHDIVAVDAESFQITSPMGRKETYEISKVDFSAEDASKGEYPHYMLKEIFEQPETVFDAMRGRLSVDEATAKLGGINMTAKELREIDRILFLGCGSARHAAMVGEGLIESLAYLPAEVEFASEFRYRNIPMDKNSLVFAVSQSGETADTLAALRESKRKGHRTLGICNNVASTIARESDGGIYMHAGPEIGVAATKSFTSQLTVMTLLALLLGRMRHLSTAEGQRLIAELYEIPDKIRTILKLNDQIREIAKKYAYHEGMLFMGRQLNFPIALEASLKLKEISYLFSEGHPSAELKHGFIALINERLPSVFIAPDDAVFEKNVSNMEEVKARKGPLIAITTEGKTEMEDIADDVIYIPESPDCLTPILAIVPLQLLAYHIAVELGCDVDKPRNLAKSVTVE